MKIAAEGLGRALRGPLPALLLATAIAIPDASARQDAPPPPEEPVLGTSAAFSGEDGDGAETIAVSEGARIYSAPHGRSTPIAIVDFDLELEVLERRGDWVRVVYGGLRGWLPADGGAAGAGDEPPPPPPPAAEGGLEELPGAHGADPQRLARARDILGVSGEPARLGDFALYTDLERPRLLAALGRLAAGLPATYGARYGLETGALDGAAVVLFAKESGYRRYESDEQDISSLWAMGHAGYGIAALFVGGRNFERAAPLLVHELAHLLNRAALGAGTPAWLEEGIANDLAFSRTDRGRRIEPGTLAGTSWMSQDSPPGTLGNRGQVTLHLDGPVAALNLVRRAERTDDLLPLAELLELPWVEFVRPEGRDLRYIQSAFLVRYLLDGGDAALERGFRAYLLAVSRGAGADAGRLLASLETSATDLESGFRRWLRSYARF